MAEVDGSTVFIRAQLLDATTERHVYASEDGIWVAPPVRAHGSLKVTFFYAETNNDETAAQPEG